MSATVTRSVIDSITDERCAELLIELIRQRSVVGEETTAHSWMGDRLRDAGMRVEEYTVENTPAPLVLGELAGGGDRPGVLFDGHFDTVFAVPDDWTRAPNGARVQSSGTANTVSKCPSKRTPGRSPPPASSPSTSGAGVFSTVYSSTRIPASRSRSPIQLCAVVSSPTTLRWRINSMRSSAQRSSVMLSITDLVTVALMTVAQSPPWLSAGRSPSTVVRIRAPVPGHRTGAA